MEDGLYRELARRVHRKYGMFILFQMARFDLAAVRIERDVIKKYLGLSRLTRSRMDSLVEDLSYLFHGLTESWDDYYESETLEWLDFFSPGVTEKSFHKLKISGAKTRHVTIDDEIFSQDEWSVTLMLDIIDEALVVKK